MQNNPQRVNRNRYTVIPRTLSFIFKRDSVLLIRYGPSKGEWAGRYNAIGGHINQGESVHTAAAREIREETGLPVDGLDARLCGTVIIDTGEAPGISLFVFIVELSGDVGGNPTTTDEGATQWVPLKIVESLDLMADVPMLLERVQQYRSSTPPPFAALYNYDTEGRLLMYFDPPAA